MSELLFHYGGFKSLFSRLSSGDNPNLKTEVQFGVPNPLVGEHVQLPMAFRSSTRSLSNTAIQNCGPRPITVKDDGQLPGLIVLARRD